MPRQPTKTALVITHVLVLCAAVAISGCGSLSQSSKSISQIISSPITSSSKSSSPGGTYRSDVADYTAAYLKSGGDASKLKGEISALAAKNGVSDWEKDDDTFRGMGAGLKQAGLSQVQLDAYIRNLATTREQAGWIQKGYDEAVTKK
jgi:hypothetical protein